ncbi:MULTISPECIES: hypothetical protein [Sinorhizobium]|nr:hypothetical protein U8C39_22230 [Sinorhizobium meliloti]WQP21719.1 hypothetical protein U8C33_22355 [Sinorhizobium meliloti]WQP35135.1 hypothetical protein U8C45_22190 [Sinorhizobium meliloti]
MEFRNPFYSRPDNSAINMEVNHPSFGWIPFTARETDIEEHCRQLFAEANAGTVAPYTPPTQEEVRANMPILTARQFRIGLVRGGFTLAQVTSAIEAMPEGASKEEAKIEWEYATTFDRMHPLIASVGAALGLSDEQIDAMWTGASAF